MVKLTYFKLLIETLAFIVDNKNKIYLYNNNRLNLLNINVIIIKMIKTYNIIINI